MPLLDRKDFKRVEPPKDLDPNEDLFYCKATQEVFRQYEQFFERVILCNSLVWGCSMTGKSNMTFQEAVESEENARNSLRTFSLALKKPLLYLASLTRNSRLNDMCDEVFNYVKDRYFVGEEVEVTINGIKKSCEVTQVVLPDRPANKSPAKNEKQTKPRDIPPAKIKYEVVDYGSGKTSVVKAEALSRPKGTYTKPRNKLYLKHHTHMKNGVFKVKDSVSSAMQMQEFQFSEVFSGPLPNYAVIEKKDKTVARKRVVQGKLNFKKETMEERKKNLEKMALTEKQKTALEKERQKVKENLKKQMEDVKLKQKEEKLKEKEKKKEEKKMIAEYLSSWKKPRDDLECDDLKELPAPTPIDCNISQDCFGDALMILEFLNTFSKQVQLKDVFPHGFSFDHIEKALTETDIQGVFNDLLQLFLTTLFRYQEAESDINIKNKEMPDLTNVTIEQAMVIAAVSASWPKKCHGTPLKELLLDSFSVTEVLRLHLLSSGAKPRVSWLGVITPSEDPGLYFKLEEPELLKKLEKTSVFELNCEERCKILSVLMHQLLACDVFKYAIDESANNTKPLRNQLRELRMNFARKQREDTGIKKKDTKEKDATNKEGVTESAAPTVDEEEKENSKDLTPEEKAKEAARLKADFQRKEREIESQLKKLQLSFNPTPIGRDRAFRRYWIFQNVAGVFVEDDDPHKGDCYPKPIPQLNHVAAATAKAESSASIKKYLQTDSKNGSSDKENEILRDIAIVQSELPFPSKNRKLSDLNPRVDLKKSSVENISEIETCLLCVNKSDNQENFIKYCPHSKANLPSDQCSANIDTCPVHNLNAPRTKWSFYYKEEELDALLISLNNRGFRERALKDAIVNEKERIQEIMLKCPANSFNRTIPQQTEQVRKSQRHQASVSSSFAGMAPQDALDLTLRDMILELEHRIYAGGLGSLKVADREAWRAAIEQGANKNLSAAEDDAKEERSLKDEIESDILKLSLPIPHEKVIKDLATAMYQLSQGIEAKYLNPPLGESEEQKKARMMKQEDDTQPKKKKYVPRLESWQESLMQCISTPQLFVHLGTLERSVAWSRSVLKAHCRICRRRGDAENMLLCDGCNRGHHIYCLKPPLKAIPEGDWFCKSCRPVEITITDTKKVRKYEESEEEEEEEVDDDDEEEEEENEEEEEEEEDDDDEEEEEDDNAAESDEEVEEEDDEESPESADEAAVQESCEECGDVGTLLCCDGCPLMYHPECVHLKRIPRGEWLCPKCSKKEEAAKKAQRNSSNGSYGTRSSKLTEKKKSNPSLKTKIGAKAVKRKYEDSFEEEFEPPTKKARDSAQNAARRRSKTGSDCDMLDYKACIDMLVELMRHPSSWPFLVPVSKKDAPGYHQKIKKPMDFGTIRSNLNYMKYKNNQEFVHDLYLVLNNCWLFNPKSSPEFKAADVLQKEIKRLLREYEITDTSPFNGHLQIGNGL